MQEPKDSDMEFGSQLLRYGGDIGFICSGFFGAVLLSIGTKKKSLTTTISTIFAGTACANYLTPLVLHFMPASIQDKGKYAVAFMMGYIGLKGLAALIDIGAAYIKKLKLPNTDNSTSR